MDALPGLHPQRDAVASGLSMAGAGAWPLLCRALGRANPFSAPAAAAGAVVCDGRGTDLARWQPFTSTSISQAAPTDWLCSALKAATQAFGDCRSRPGTGWTISKLEYPPFLSPSTCWGRADFFIQNCKVSRLNCPQGRESLFWPSEQGTHKLGDEEGSRLLLLNKDHMAGMCVY